MMKTLSTFAALSMAGTVLLSLIPEGGLKRTAGMVMGLLTLLCWAEAIAACLGFDIPEWETSTALTSTAFDVDQAMADACAMLSAQWEGSH